MSAFFCLPLGQKLNDDQAEAIDNLPLDAKWSQRLLIKHRKLVGILIPLIFCQAIWWSLAIKWNFFALFEERWAMSVTMIFGALVAGMA